MRWIVIGAAVAGVLGAAPATAQVFKCEQDDQIVYSQHPCATDAEEITPSGGLERSTGYVTPSRPRARSSSRTQSSAGGGRQRNDTQQQVLAWCASEWPDNFRMQEHCYNRQVAAAGDLHEIMESVRGQTDLERTIIQCVRQWDLPGDIYNYRMALHCTNRQIESHRRLQ